MPGNDLFRGHALLVSACQFKWCNLRVLLENIQITEETPAPNWAASRPNLNLTRHNLVMGSRQLQCQSWRSDQWVLSSHYPIITRVLRSLLHQNSVIITTSLYTDQPTYENTWKFSKRPVKSFLLQQLSPGTILDWRHKHSLTRWRQY